MEILYNKVYICWLNDDHVAWNINGKRPISVENMFIVLKMLFCVAVKSCGTIKAMK